MLVLTGLGIYHHFSHFLPHLETTVEAVKTADISSVNPKHIDVAPVLGAGFAAHIFEAPKHGTHFFTDARDDLKDAHEEYGTLKMLAGVGLLLVFIAWLACFGIYWWPLVVRATWIGKVAWTAVFTGLLGGCLKLKDRWKEWKPNADATANPSAA